MFSFECNDSLRAVEGNIADYGLVPYFDEQMLYVLEARVCRIMYFLND